MWLTFDFQFLANPSYNADRGPSHLRWSRALAIPAQDSEKCAAVF
jgi:hypothetical protein